MRKHLLLFLILCLLLVPITLTACSTPVYPGLPDANIEGKDPMKGVEVYCWQEGIEWKCGAILGTNRMKSDEEIRSLQVVTIPQMKRILEQKGLSDCFSVIIVDLSGDEVVYLTGEEYDYQWGLLMMQLGTES